MSRTSNDNKGGANGMTRGLKKGVIKHLARTTQKCVDDVAAGKEASKRCKVLQEFKDLLAVCKV